MHERGLVILRFRVKEWAWVRHCVVQMTEKVYYDANHVKRIVSYWCFKM
jgi:hypothetical protein